jgi:hypothetical protein
MVSSLGLYTLRHGSFRLQSRGTSDRCTIEFGSRLTGDMEMLEL